LANVLHLQPEELSKDVWVSKDKSGKSAWQIAVEGGHVGVLEEPSDWTK